MTGWVKATSGILVRRRFAIVVLLFVVDLIHELENSLRFRLFGQSVPFAESVNRGEVLQRLNFLGLWGNRQSNLQFKVRIILDASSSSKFPT